MAPATAPPTPRTQARISTRNSTYIPATRKIYAGSTLIRRTRIQTRPPASLNMLKGAIDTLEIDSEEAQAEERAEFVLVVRGKEPGLYTNPYAAFSSPFACCLVLNKDLGM